MVGEDIVYEGLVTGDFIKNSELRRDDRYIEVDR